MRTTLSLDDDIEKRLREEARQSGRSLKDVVNDAIRRGLAAGAAPVVRPKRFRVLSKACGFQPGIDPQKLNQLVDEMDFERASVIPRIDEPLR